MSTRVRRAAVTPSHVAVGVLIAFCALLLLKWLALVALIALGLAGILWWARRDPTVPLPAPRAGQAPLPVTPRVASDDDCSWCGLAGGHRDAAGHLVRPRHVHGR